MTSPMAVPATEASSTLYFGPWYRRSPFFEKTLAAGCSAYDIYNHMYLPGYYADPVEEYWALLNDVTVWDVSVERIVEISAARGDLSRVRRDPGGGRSGTARADVRRAPGEGRGARDDPLAAGTPQLGGRRCPFSRARSARPRGRGRDRRLVRGLPVRPPA